VVGKGKAATNVIGDVKFSGASKRGTSSIYSGKEKAGHISSFDNAAKNEYGQLVRNIRQARATGSIDPETAYHAIRGAKAGEVLHEVVPSGYNVGVSAKIQQRYQPSVTPSDQFAEAVSHRQSVQITQSLRAGTIEAGSRGVTDALGGGGAKSVIMPPSSPVETAGPVPKSVSRIASRVGSVVGTGVTWGLVGYQAAQHTAEIYSKSGDPAAVHDATVNAALDMAWTGVLIGVSIANPPVGFLLGVLTLAHD
jgi:hypothetical protein